MLVAYLPSTELSGTNSMSYCAAQWHKKYVLLCSTVAQTTCRTVRHSGTINMSYCAAQCHKQHVVLCSTVAQATCPTMQHSGTSNMSYCAAQWHKQHAPLCWSSENLKVREGIQHGLLPVTSHSNQIKNPNMSVCQCFSKWLSTRPFRM